MNLSAKDEARFWSKVDRSGDCWNWTSKSVCKNGYGTFQCGGRGGPQYRAPRVAYSLLIGPIPKGKLVLHRCDNPKCVNPGHLYVGDHKQNMLDMRVRERSWKTKLTAKDVREIRLASKVESQKKLARRYGVVEGTIYHITSGLTWRHVEPC